MKRLKVIVVGTGLHPDLRVVRFKTEKGREEISVHKTSILDENLGFTSIASISVDYPIFIGEKTVIIELPAENSFGAWRVEVPNSELIDDNHPSDTLDLVGENLRLREALKGMLYEWEQLSRWGSTMAKKANERVNAAYAALKQRTY